MIEFLEALATNPLYWASMAFLAGFPIVMSALVVNGSRNFLLERSREATEQYFPHKPELSQAREKWPVASVIISARDEEQTIASTIEAVFKLDWPQIDLVVINDGSRDATADILANLQRDRKITLITHEEAKGKAQSLNEGLVVAASDVVLIIDADSAPAPNSLNRMIPYFIQYRDSAAVTGNPRVVNASILWTKLQAIEFTSTISALRRSQSAWGRINTVSGVLSVLRRDIVLQLGGFSPTQPTEDIELTWRLHREGYRCLYEPAALVAMRVPETLGQWWRQRYRWSSGLVRVLQQHGIALVKEGRWPMFPLLTEAVLSIVWCHLLIVATILWLTAFFVGGPEVGNSLIIGHWGALAVGVALVQIFWGMHLDSHHDRTIVKLWPLAPIYPILYWWVEAFVVVAATLPTLVTTPRTVTWSLDRSAGTNGKRV